MKQLTIERKILIPFLVVVIIPIIAIGTVSYLTGFSSYQEQVFAQTEQTVEQWFLYTNHLREEEDSGHLSSATKQRLLDVWTDRYPELKNLKPYSSTSTIPQFHTYIDGDGWYQVDSSNFWRQEWLYIKKNPKTNDRYVYPLTIRIWTESLLEIQKYTILVMIIAGIIAVQLTIILSHHLAKPIRLLAAFCQAIGTGNETLPKLEELEGRRDEIEVLGNRLNEMVQNLAEKNNAVLRLKEFQDTILQSTLLGIYTIRIDGHFLSSNSRWKALIAEVPILQEKVENWLQEDSDNSSSEHHRLQEMWYLSSASGEKVILINKAPLIHENGDVIGVLCTAEDITDRKRFEDKMERIDRLTSLGELAAGLAHEIRNPLAGMKTTSQVLRRRLRLDEQNLSLFKSIEQEIDRLNKTITSLLLFSRPKSAEREAVVLVEVLTETLQMLSQSIHDKQILIEQHLLPSLTLYVDRDHLKQILLNLFLNAIKIMDQKGRLMISADHLDEHIQIKITDFGPGMDEDVKDKIFNPFFTTDSKGTGLGLSVVHQLVVQNEGEIDVISKKGVGTTFILLFQREGGV